jgi:hypothetical protein
MEIGCPAWPRRLAGAQRTGVCERRTLGARPGIPPHRHRQAYGNEESVGNALRNSGMTRDRVFRLGSIQDAKTPLPKPSKPSAARRRPADLVPRLLAAARSWPGRVWSALGAGIRPFHRHLQLQRSRTTRGDRLSDDPAGRQPSAIQLTAVPARAARRFATTERRARGLHAPWGPAATSLTRR